MHHTILINEFGNTAFVFNERDTICAYMLVFTPRPSLCSLCAFDCCHEYYKRLGLGRKLYEHFIKCASEKKCSKVKAITKPTNLESIAFHKSVGMELTGNCVIDGIPVVFDYRGLGKNRVVFIKEI